MRTNVSTQAIYSAIYSAISAFLLTFPGFQGPHRIERDLELMWHRLETRCPGVDLRHRLAHPTDSGTVFLYKTGLPAEQQKATDRNAPVTE
jgi:hypothetical protein